MREQGRTVREELRHIPTSHESLPQALLRLEYGFRRRYDIRKSSKPKEETLLYCIRDIRRTYPSWQPDYDATFFRLAA